MNVVDEVELEDDHYDIYFFYYTLPHPTMVF